MRLLHVLSYQPKEHVEDNPNPYVGDLPRLPKKNAKRNYQFADKFLKSKSLLLAYCKHEKLDCIIRKHGVMVYGITNKQINEARKKFNKTAHKNPITL